MNWLDEVRWDERGLIPVIAQEAATGDVLMFAWMNREALQETAESGRAVYFSRSRSRLWRSVTRASCKHLDLSAFDRLAIAHHEHAQRTMAKAKLAHDVDFAVGNRDLHAVLHRLATQTPRQRVTARHDAVDAVRAFGAAVVLITVIVDRGGTCAAMAAEAGIRYEPMLVAPDLGFEFGS